MDIETKSPVKQMQEQLPRIRQVTRLDDIKKTAPEKVPAPILQKSAVQQKRHISLSIFIAAVILFAAIFIFEIAVIYKYNTLSKRLYDIALKHKTEAEGLSINLKHTNRLNNILQSRKEMLTGNYINLLTGYRMLQHKMNKTVADYSNILFEKSSFIDLLKNKLYIADTRGSAWKIQNEILKQELQKKGEYVNELTGKLVYNITQQEALVKENLGIKKDKEELLRKIALISANTEKEQTENKNVDK